MGKYIPGAAIVIHDKPWTVRPGEPQSVRDAYDRLLAEKGQMWTGDSAADDEAPSGSDGALSTCREAR